MSDRNASEEEKYIEEIIDFIDHLFKNIEYKAKVNQLFKYCFIKHAYSEDEWKNKISLKYHNLNKYYNNQIFNNGYKDYERIGKNYGYKNGNGDADRLQM